MDQTGAESPVPRLRPRVPAQEGRPMAGSEIRPGVRGGPWAGDPRPDQAARGEHGRSEPSAPVPPTAPVRAPGDGASGGTDPAGPTPTAPRRLPQRHSVRGQVLEALRGALVGGELRPGEVYSAPALAERFGVSATPVREAMQLLACEGAVEVVPNRGFRVARRTARDLAELAEVRALIEVPVMLRLARTVPPERWEELRPLAAETVAAAARGDRIAYAESDRVFHHALLSLTGNRQLALVGDELHRRAQAPLADGSIVHAADLLADAAEHTALLDALTAQDLPVVEQLIHEHFAGVRRTY